ncbi:ABC transporter ATP-binding protein [Homoserinibacter gongjuensis]|uniref:ABC transporter n=1 Tax=Homoserinibacter gongjuensis TaxID=1162968 RepID=A0ABQ6JTG1_9MICO|nr:ABC transporter ATP-binding protein [Homoserinibacter gongjuensis]GMA91274.1 ABC transporter [Homoserinibacter gongjuensis]
MTLAGVEGEDRQDYTREESRAIRARSSRLLGSLLRPLRGRVVVAMLIVATSTALQTAGPALIAFGIDAGLPAILNHQDAMPLAVVVLLYLGAAIVGAVLMWHYTMLSARISQAFLFDLRGRIYRHAQLLSLEFHESYTSGRIIARQTNDLDSIRELLDSGIQGLIRGALYMVFIAATLLFLDPISALVIACSVPVLLVLTRWFQVTSQRAFRATRVHSARLIVKFVETMTGIRAVKAFRAEQRNAGEFGATNESYRDANAKAIGVFGIFDPSLVVIGNIVVAVVLLVGGLRVADGGLAVGVLLAALMYTRRFFDPMEEMAQFYNSYQSASAALEKISGVLEESPSVPDPVRPVDLWTAKGALDFDDVRFAYHEDRVILPDFELHIPAGQTVALVGSTGAGKSTLAKLVARFYDPTDGVVRLDGVDLRDVHPKDLRRAIVMVTQEAYLFSGTVADNIALGKPGATLDEIRAAAHAVGADTFIEALPQGYDTDVNKRGGRVSAGQRQLLSFARAFLADPAVLILDEATASLDIPSERLVQEGLTTLLADRTAIVIAHRLSTVAIADRVLVMEHGRIVEDGTPAELIGGDGRFATLHKAWRDSLV